MKLICYLSNGYPSLEESAQTALVYAQAGCDIVEVDLPARDPYLEGELIAGRMADALEACGDYEQYMDNIVKIATEVGDRAEILLLAYVNTLLEVGVERFIEFCQDNGFQDLILVGLEDDTVKERLINAGIRVSCYVQRTLDPAEVDAAKNSNGFVYLQAASDKVNPDYPTLADCVRYLRDQGVNRPIYCGVGVSTPADFRAVSEAGGDGAFVGSTILKVAGDPRQLTQTIQEFAAARP